MCGRFNIISDPLVLFLAETLSINLKFPTRYNIAPTTDIPVIVNNANQLEQKIMRWWLIPSWAKEISTQYSMFNARSENVEKSPAFRSLIKQKRCVIPASGYYEWIKQSSGSKQPYLIETHNNEQKGGLLFAGLWDCWQNQNEVIHSCTIITTQSDPSIKHLHHRMPVILNNNDVDQQRNCIDIWLNSDSSQQQVKALLAPELKASLKITPVSNFVSNSRNEGEKCIEAISDSFIINK